MHTEIQAYEFTHASHIVRARVLLNVSGYETSGTRKKLYVCACTWNLFLRLHAYNVLLCAAPTKIFT